MMKRTKRLPAAPNKPFCDTTLDPHTATNGASRPVRVWDLPVRLFNWLTVRSYWNLCDIATELVELAHLAWRRCADREDCVANGGPPYETTPPRIANMTHRQYDKRTTRQALVERAG